MDRFDVMLDPATDRVPGVAGVGTSSIAAQAIGDGQRSLQVDLSDETSLAFVKIISNGAAGFGGTVAGPTSFDFASITHLTMVLTPFADSVALDASPLAARATLSLDGGAGLDSLTVDFTGLKNVVFEADAAGNVHSNYGSFAGFEDYTIRLGGGVNSVTTGFEGDQVSTRSGSINTINTGDGMDRIDSMGIDHVDGGYGYDFWFGNYASSRLALTFSMHDTSGTLSNGTTLTNVESFNLITGSGNDRFDIVDVRSFAGALVDGGRGRDVLSVDYSDSSDFGAASFIRSNGERGFSGDLFGSDAELSFNNIEMLTFLAGLGDDVIRVDASASRAGATLIINGGEGSDSVVVGGLLAGHSILPDGTGGLIINDIDRSDGDSGTFTIRNVERVVFDDGMVDLAPLAVAPAQDLFLI